MATVEELAAKIEVWSTELEIAKRRIEPEVFSVNTPTDFKEVWSTIDILVCRMRETIDNHKNYLSDLAAESQQSA